LDEHFTVFAVDRRGRGASGDETPEYRMELEFEDMRAVVSSIAEPVRLLGHSYGAICSLEGALRASNVCKLVLYEPPISTGEPIYSPELLERLELALGRGEREEVVEMFFREVVRAPESEMELLKSTPVWQMRVRAAHTLPREMRASVEYSPVAERFASLAVPTLLLLGGVSPPYFGAATTFVHRLVPGSRIEELPGQQHTAMNTAPEMFLSKVLEFLTDARG
jgi:pimeloyl-ACP methyl ester carboxylesterase